MRLGFLFSSLFIVEITVQYLQCRVKIWTTVFSVEEYDDKIFAGGCKAPHYITVDVDVCQIHDMYLRHSGIPSRVEHFLLKLKFYFGDICGRAKRCLINGRYKEIHVYVLGNLLTFFIQSTELGLLSCGCDFM